MSNPPFTVDTGLYYPLANPFSFNHGDEYDFDSTCELATQLIGFSPNRIMF